MKDPVTFYPSGDSTLEDASGSESPVLKARSSRRAFIKGIIASGAVAGSSTFIFGGLGGCSSDQPVAGTIERLISLNVNGQVRRVDVLPNETLAKRMHANLEKAGGVRYSPEEVAFAKKIRETIGKSDLELGSESSIQPYELQMTKGSTDVGDVSWVVPTTGLSTATWVASLARRALLGTI